jgi:hypothetical protein
MQKKLQHIKTAKQKLPASPCMQKSRRKMKEIAVNREAGVANIRWSSQKGGSPCTNKPMAALI